MYNNYKEIVTKAIVGKGKKVFKDEYEILVDNNVSSVLGCWVINHKIRGKKDDDYIKINGNFDVNIWYSYDNNSKTNVISKKVYYEERVKVKARGSYELSDMDEIIIRSLKNPTCIDVTNDNNTIKYTISKELGIEVVGETKIRIAVSNNEEEYDLIIDEKSINEQIDKEINENYISDKEN